VTSAAFWEVILRLAASGGTPVALGASAVEAVFEGGEEAVWLGVYSAVGLDGCAGCGLQPANITKIESPMRNRKMVFIRASIFYRLTSLTCSANGYVLWLELEIANNLPVSRQAWFPTYQSMVCLHQPTL
jgi:hypothetical protein